MPTVNPIKKQTLLTLVGIALVSASSLLAPQVGALEATKNTLKFEAAEYKSTQTINQPSRSIAMAQSRNYCRPTESLFVVAETQDFWLNICGGDLPNTYVGTNKRTGDSIRLPLYSYEADGSAFEARNGNVRYLLTRGTTKGDVLVVLQGGREILRQFVTNWE
ncbi:hypothetical protein [Lyngbya aestuarii]|uniref:hypothetical protein n=1 Tax=Lyngbya aestuarii TaxID=118322 RepID=UPI00403E0FDB